MYSSPSNFFSISHGREFLFIDQFDTELFIFLNSLFNFLEKFQELEELESHIKQLVPQFKKLMKFLNKTSVSRMQAQRLTENKRIKILFQLRDTILKSKHEESWPFLDTTAKLGIILSHLDFESFIFKSSTHTSSSIHFTNTESIIKWIIEQKKIDHLIKMFVTLFKQCENANQLREIVAANLKKIIEQEENFSELLANLLVDCPEFFALILPPPLSFGQAPYLVTDVDLEKFFSLLQQIGFYVEKEIDLLLFNLFNTQTKEEFEPSIMTCARKAILAKKLLETEYRLLILHFSTLASIMEWLSLKDRKVVVKGFNLISLFKTMEDVLSFLRMPPEVAVLYFVETLTFFQNESIRNLISNKKELLTLLLSIHRDRHKDEMKSMIINLISDQRIEDLYYLLKTEHIEIPVQLDIIITEFLVEKYNKLCLEIFLQSFLLLEESDQSFLLVPYPLLNIMVTYIIPDIFIIPNARYLQQILETSSKDATKNKAKDALLTAIFQQQPEYRSTVISYLIKFYSKEFEQWQKESQDPANPLALKYPSLFTELKQFPKEALEQEIKNAKESVAKKLQQR